jgi:uncharacterized protein YecT (DUF1311 family)
MMMKKIVCIFVSLCAFGSLASAQDSKPDPLDQADSACLDKANNTVEMVDCGTASYKRWDAELNRVYVDLRKHLDATGQAALKDSQTKWLAYRDAELKTIKAIYSAQAGSVNLPMSGGAATQIIRHRAQELRGYAELYKPQG